MAVILGRDRPDGPVADVGTYRALDGSSGAQVGLDVDGPHAIAVVGKRGYGKSYTLGVLAEELAATPGVAPIVVDPMGVFDGLANSAAGSGDSSGASPAVELVDDPRVSPDALDPRAWCGLLGLDPESGAGSLLWRAAGAASTVDGMRSHVADATAPDSDVRAAVNHLSMAERWDVFEPAGLAADDLVDPDGTVLDVSGLDAGPMNAVCRAAANSLYRARVADDIACLPWVLVDEAHAFFDGIAGEGLETLLTRGRAPGVSLVTATQRPSALPSVCLSQSDLVVSHRLTSRADLSALEAVEPTYLDGSLAARMPTEPGEVVVVDDVTETVNAARIRERRTPHGGESPRASELADASGQ